MTTASSTGIHSILSLPFIIPFQIFGEIFGPNAWFLNTPENVLFRTKGSSLDIVIAICVSFDPTGQAPRILRNYSPLSQGASVMSLQGYPTKRAGKAVLWSTGSVTSYSYQSFTPRCNADYMFQNPHLRLHRGYMPFKADEMEVIQQTTEASVKFHDNYWKMYPMKVRPRSLRFVGVCLSDFHALAPCTTTKSFIHALLNPNLTHRLTVDPALSDLRLTNFPAPTEHDHCGLHENFDPRPTPVQLDRRGPYLSRFAKSDGANNQKGPAHSL